MRIFRNISSIDIEKPVATIGIFDGVHIAHQAIIDTLNKEAAKHEGESTILTLWPHPRIVLNKDADSLRLINTLEEKIERLEKSGVDNLIILPFDKDLAATGFANFVKKILVDGIGIEHLVVGFNHQFGKNREGNYEALKDMAKKYEFSLTQLAPVVSNNEKISSSKIRMYIEKGDFSKANAMLGYNFSITGSVVEGNKLGRDLGFPTANISIENSIKIVPKNGVYAVFVRIEDSVYSGMMNIGFRPTVQTDVKEAVIEVHIFGFNNDLYGRKIQVEIIQRIREEKKFRSKEELVSQIKADQYAVSEILESNKK